jgi:hypothetical protein
MPSKVVDEIDQAGLGKVPLVDPAAEDAVLVVAAKSGDRHAFEILVARHEQRILFVGFSSLRGALRAREKTPRISCSKAFKKLSPICANSKGDLPFLPG